MSTKNNQWKDLPCEVPGYSGTSLEYVNTIKHHIERGEFALAWHYLDAAKNANVLHRLEFAAEKD